VWGFAIKRIPMNLLKDRKRVLNEIKKSGITQVELSKATGISQGNLSVILSGNKSVEIDTLIKISDAAGLKITFSPKSKH